jgi:hypothetical protein
VVCTQYAVRDTRFFRIEVTLTSTAPMMGLNILKMLRTLHVCGEMLAAFNAIEVYGAVLKMFF